MKIYVVQGSQGEYSDRMEWIYKAYRDEKTAKNQVEYLNVKFREFKNIYDKLDTFLITPEMEKLSKDWIETDISAPEYYDYRSYERSYFLTEAELE